jgi:CubicO group peptidase (beta-lactamase class C family)
MAALNIPGLSVAVFDSGQIVWTRSYGVTDVNTGEKVDSSTLFQAASISKPVTSVGMFRLVEQGRLSLDEDVNERLRSWAIPENSFTRVEKVTPRRIVTHMGGLTVGGFAGYARGEPVPSVHQILNGEAPANSPAVRVDTFPGARESYSGGGFVLLQLLMEEVSAQSFPSLMTDLVLRPARMTHSTFSQPLLDELLDRAATGHDSRGAPVPGRHHVHPELAPAGMWSTPADIARFMLAVGRSYRGEPDGLLEPASARTMLTHVPGGSGQGFGLSGEGDAFRYRHSGGNVGFTCYAVAFAGVGRGMVVMTNSDAGSQLIRELTRAVSREYGWPRMWVRE